jgi:hypothetical protein
MKPAALILPFLLTAPAAFCQEPWYAPSRPEIIIPEASQPADALAGCPRLRALNASENYTDKPAVREVSEVTAATLPLPADDLDRAGLLEILKTDLDYWTARPD